MRSAHDGANGRPHVPSRPRSLRYVQRRRRVYAKLWSLNIKPWSPTVRLRSSANPETELNPAPCTLKPRHAYGLGFHLDRLIKSAGMARIPLQVCVCVCVCVCARVHACVYVCMSVYFPMHFTSDFKAAEMTLNETIDF